jgi:glycolate oxidase FAD binding subunit
MDAPARDLTDQLRQRVTAAMDTASPLAITGSGSKSFLGNRCDGEPLQVSGHSGIVHYDPTELVVTARSGTRLADLEDILAAQGQMLACESPRFGPDATIGGTLGCNLSGPRRPYAGALRDFVLGTRIINGRGEVLRFGGEVMKNVAGYDLSRLMAGAMGTLGVVLEVSLKVLPRPETVVTLLQDSTGEEALARFHQWSRRPWPISAAAHLEGRLYLRLEGTVGGVAAARAAIGGEEDPAGDAFWHALREQQLTFFAGPLPLWRLSLPSNARPEPLGETLLEWGGAQRWLRSDASPERVQGAAAAAGGHATLYRGLPEIQGRFQPLPEAVARLHRSLKQALDPQGLFNPGRLYPDL